MSFKESFAAGKFAERLVQRLLTEAGIKSRLNDGADRSTLIEWDIEAELHNKRFTLECKYDVMAAKTGNLAIEYYNTRLAKPSGITATNADLWVVVLANPQAVYIANTEKLRRYCAEVKPFRSIASGGDQNAAMYLYRKNNILSDVFVCVDQTSPALLPDLLSQLLAVFSQS